MSELTEETGKELIAAINRLTLIIKPVPVLCGITGWV